MFFMRPSWLSSLVVALLLVLGFAAALEVTLTSCSCNSPVAASSATSSSLVLYTLTVLLRFLPPTAASSWEWWLTPHWLGWCAVPRFCATPCLAGFGAGWPGPERAYGSRHVGTYRPPSSVRCCTLRGGCCWCGCSAWPSRTSLAFHAASVVLCIVIYYHIHATTVLCTRSLVSCCCTRRDSPSLRNAASLTTGGRRQAGK